MRVITKSIAKQGECCFYSRMYPSGEFLVLQAQRQLTRGSDINNTFISTGLTKYKNKIIQNSVKAIEYGNYATGTAELIGAVLINSHNPDANFVVAYGPYFDALRHYGQGFFFHFAGNKDIRLLIKKIVDKWSCKANGLLLRQNLFKFLERSFL